MTKRTGFKKKLIDHFFLSVICSFTLILFTPQISICQKTEFKPDQYRAINWSSDNGVALGIHLVLKDSKGFTWVGPQYNSMTHFDGARFETFAPDEGKPGSILGNGINSIVEDSLHNIWTGHSKGLSRYETQADTFTNFKNENDSVFTDRSTVAIWSTKNELIALESGTRIVIYNIKTLEKRLVGRLTKEEIDETTIPFFSVYEQETQSLWMPVSGKNDALHQGGGLMEVSLKYGWKKFYGWNCFRHIPNDNHTSEDIVYDRKRKSIWINSNDGLLEFPLNEKKFHLADGFGEFIKVKDYGRFVGIDIDPQGRIWLATHPAGVLIYDPETKHVSPLFSDTTARKNTGENNMQIYCCRDGIVWLTYWDNRGLYELLPYKPSVKLYPSLPGVKDSLDGSVGDIIPAGQGKIWITGFENFNLFHAASEKFEVVKAADFPGIKAEKIFPAKTDTVARKAWLISYPQGQLYEMDMASRKSDMIIFRSGNKIIDSLNLAGNMIRSYNKGLLIYDLNHGFFEKKKDSLVADLIIPFHDFIGRIELINDSLLFLKNPNYPYNFTFKIQNGKWARTAHLMDTLDWTSFLKSEHDHSIWVGFDNKLIHYDKNFQVIKIFDKEQGYSGMIQKMIEDQEGNIWFGNDKKQIGQINYKTGTIRTLSPSDGYHPQFFDWFTPGARDAEGNIYFGESGLGVGKVGLLRIDPKKYITSNPSIVYLSSLRINYKPYPLPIGINQLENLDLPYNLNSISIETGIIDYYSMGKGNIRYKLEVNGNPAEWQYGPAYYTLRFEDLRVGKYRLILQSSNSSNEFMGEEKILDIQIHPPWWQTWWARALFFLAFIFALLTFIQYRSRNLRNKNLELENKVMHRTKELKLSLEELRATQHQLIQREKMASLGELTAGIAHEIQNPLNFINNFSDLNSELIEELKAEQKKENRDYAGEEHMLDDIQKNEEKINHHGKRADSIVKGMLQHSRTNTGEKELTDINALVDEYLRLSYHGMRAKEKSFNATINTSFDEQIGKVKLVAQDIGRVLLNLFNNAFYSVNEKKSQHPTGYEPTVSVSTKKINNRVEIRIRDNGNGIPQKVLDKIYNPFFTTKPPGEGTGLGLSLSYDIVVKIHGGELKVDTQEGEFAEFIISLPV
jgi:signal transduction histidine kinase/streptogramin lyase